MSDEAHITIQRGKSYANREFPYMVVLDGVVVASVRRSESVTVPVSAGSHTLRLRIDWCGSEDLQFKAAAGERIIFECGSNLTGWRFLLSLYYVTFQTRRYLWLRRVT